jgi:hypothetical protein
MSYKSYSFAVKAPVADDRFFLCSPVRVYGTSTSRLWIPMMVMGDSEFIVMAYSGT